MQIIKATILKITYDEVSLVIWAGLAVAAMFSQMSRNICRSDSMYLNPLGCPVKMYFQLSQIHVMDSVKSVYLLHTQYVKAKQSETCNQMYWMKQMLMQCHKVTCAPSSYG